MLLVSFRSYVRWLVDVVVAILTHRECYAMHALCVFILD